MSRKTWLPLIAIAVFYGVVLWYSISDGQSPSAVQQPTVQVPLAQTPPAPPVQPQVTPPAPPTQALPPAGQLLQYEQNTVEVIRRYGNGVVYVSVRSAPRQAGSGSRGFAPFVQPPREGTGSGFVIDTQGLILTNYHVVRNVATITVRFRNDPRPYTAQVVGTAEPLDLALLRTDAPRNLLVPLALGDSGNLQGGQKTIAMGNPFGLDFSVSTGVVSAVRRNPGSDEPLVPTLVQTDAAINPGNSGGPLMNSSGQVIGINSAIISPAGAVGGAQSGGVGFAIPINLVKEYLPQLRAGQRLTAEAVLATRPRIGVSVAPVAEYPTSLLGRNNLPDRGLMVQEVTPNSPAARAGLRAATQSETIRLPDGSSVELGVNGDVLLEANGRPLSDPSDLQSLVFGTRAGQALNLRVWRGGQTLNLSLIPEIIPQGTTR